FDCDWSSDVCSSDLARVAVALEAARVRAELVVEQHQLGALADRLEVAERRGLAGDRAAVHPDPQTVGAARVTRRAVEQIPDLERSEERRVGKECNEW